MQGCDHDTFPGTLALNQHSPFGHLTNSFAMPEVLCRPVELGDGSLSGEHKGKLPMAVQTESHLSSSDPELK